MACLFPTGIDGDVVIDHLGDRHPNYMLQSIRNDKFETVAHYYNKWVSFYLNTCRYKRFFKDMYTTGKMSVNVSILLEEN